MYVCGRFCCPGTFGSVWRDLGFTVGRLPLTTTGWRIGVLPVKHHGMNQTAPTTKSDPTQNVSSAEVEKPWPSSFTADGKHS